MTRFPNYAARGRTPPPSLFFLVKLLSWRKIKSRKVMYVIARRKQLDARFSSRTTAGYITTRATMAPDPTSRPPPVKGRADDNLPGCWFSFAHSLPHHFCPSSPRGRLAAVPPALDETLCAPASHQQLINPLLNVYQLSWCVIYTWLLAPFVNARNLFTLEC